MSGSARRAKNLVSGDKRTAVKYNAFESRSHVMSVGLITPSYFVMSCLPFQSEICPFTANEIRIVLVEVVAWQWRV